MNAQAGQVTALTSRQLLWREAAAIIVTVAVILIWSYAVTRLAVADEITASSLDERIMRAGCRLPDTDGSATLFLRFMNKGFCWRFR